MKPLKGMNCLLTGGTRGIGRATVFAVADAAANVAFIYGSSKAAANELEELIQAKGVRCKGYRCDISKAGEVDEVVKNILYDFGAISILVNNAGITFDRVFHQMTKNIWDQVMEVNLGGLFNVTKAVWPRMCELGWGRIINVSSVTAAEGRFAQTNESASKGGVEGFTFALAREAASKGITVNAVAPGCIETDMTLDLPADLLERHRDMIPLRRFGKPEEVAAVIVSMASPEWSYVTGAVIPVNGGMRMG